MKKMIVVFLIISLSVLAEWDSRSSEAAEYPVKPITVIVPMETGSDADVMGRPIFQRVSAILGKPLVVANKPGGGQTIGMREIYSAKPDGYTIGLANISLVTAKMQGLLSFDHRDVTSIGLMHRSSAVIIASSKSNRPFKTYEEAASFAKEHPGEVSLLTSAKGGPLWLGGVLLQKKTNLKFNIIPQEGSAGFIVSQLAGGHGDLGVTFFASAKAQIDAGTIRCLAVMGNEHYPGKFSDIRLMREIGNDITMYSFSAIIGPPKLPKEITNKLISAFGTAMKEPEIVNFITFRNTFVDFRPGAQFVEFCQEQRDTFLPLLKEAGALKEK